MFIKSKIGIRYEGEIWVCESSFEFVKYKTHWIVISPNKRSNLLINQLIFG